MDIPNEKLADFLNIMEQACTRLEKYHSLPVKEYDQSWEIQDIIERELQQGIQASMDAAMRRKVYEHLRSDPSTGISETL